MVESKRVLLLVQEILQGILKDKDSGDPTKGRTQGERLLEKVGASLSKLRVRKGGLGVPMGSSLKDH